MNRRDLLRLTPVVALAPIAFEGTEEFKKAEEKLDPGEYLFVVDPLFISPESLEHVQFERVGGPIIYTNVGALDGHLPIQIYKVR